MLNGVSRKVPKFEEKKLRTYKKYHKKKKKKINSIVSLFHVSCVMCHVSRITCHMSQAICQNGMVQIRTQLITSGYDW